jgi:hypothetical protein
MVIPPKPQPSPRLHESIQKPEQDIIMLHKPQPKPSTSLHETKERNNANQETVLPKTELVTAAELLCSLEKGGKVIPGIQHKIIQIDSELCGVWWFPDQKLVRIAFQGTKNMVQGLRNAVGAGMVIGDMVDGWIALKGRGFVASMSKMAWAFDLNRHAATLLKAASDWLRGLGMDDLSKCKWSISGHSRGGLLAFHAGWQVAHGNRRLGSLVHVITFGAPHASRHEDNGMMSNYVFRVVNRGDPVPQLLSSSVEAEHVGRICKFMEATWDLQHHNINTYMDALFAFEKHQVHFQIPPVVPYDKTKQFPIAGNGGNVQGQAIGKALSSGVPNAVPALGIANLVVGCVNLGVGVYNTYQVTKIRQDVANLSTNIENNLVNQMAGMENNIANQMAGMENNIANQMAGMENKLVNQMSSMSLQITQLDEKLDAIGTKLDDGFSKLFKGQNAIFVNLVKVADDMKLQYELLKGIDAKVDVVINMQDEIDIKTNVLADEYRRLFCEIDSQIGRVKDLRPLARELQLRAEKSLRSTHIGSAKRFMYFVALTLALRVQQDIADVTEEGTTPMLDSKLTQRIREEAYAIANKEAFFPAIGNCVLLNYFLLCQGLVCGEAVQKVLMTNRRAITQDDSTTLVDIPNIDFDNLQPCILLYNIISKLPVVDSLQNTTHSINNYSREIVPWVEDGLIQLDWVLRSLEVAPRDLSTLSASDKDTLIQIATPSFQLDVTLLLMSGFDWEEMPPYWSQHTYYPHHEIAVRLIHEKCTIDGLNSADRIAAWMKRKIWDYDWGGDDAMAESVIRQLDEAAFEAVLSAMSHHQSHVEIQEIGCQAVNNLGYNCKNRDDLCKAGCDAVLRAMIVHENNAGIQEIGIRYIMDDDENRKYLGQAGCDAVFRAMTRHESDSDIQHLGCWIIAKWAINDENKKYLGKDGCDAVVRSMSRHEGNADIQLQGCCTIATLAINDENRKYLGKDGCDAVVRGMIRHETNADIQQYGCKAIINLASNNDENNKYLGKDGCDAVVRAMSHYESNADIQENGCQAIAQLAITDENRKYLGKDGCDAVVRAMTCHESNSDIQHLGCWIIAKLALNNDENRKYLGKDGCDAVVRGMSRHETNADIQQYGCWAIINLAGNNDENKKYLGKDGCDAVVRAMSHYETNADIQHNGCKAIINLAANHDENNKYLGKDGCDAVVRAMSHYEANADIQEKGRWAIRHLAANDENRNYLLQLGRY